MRFDLTGSKPVLGEAFAEMGRGIHNLYIMFVCVLVLCEACREGHDGGTWSSQYTDLLLVKLVMYLLTLLILPVEVTFSLTKR